MRARLIALICAVLALAPLAGCKIDTINSFSSKPAQVRVANFLSETDTLDFRSGEVTLWANVAKETVTDYRDFDADQQIFALRTPAATTDLNQATYVLAGDQRYTLFAIGTTANPTMHIVPDAVTGPGGDSFRLRMLNFAPEWYSVDVYLTAPGDDITNASPVSSGLLYASTGVYQTRGAGNYRVRVTQQGTKTVIYDSGSIAFNGDSVVNGVIYSRKSGSLVNMGFLETTGTAKLKLVDTPTARVRVVNLTPNVGALNVKADGAGFVSNIAYPTSSDYTETAAGTRKITVESSLTPGAPIAQVTRTLLAATDTTIYVTGTPGLVSATALDDNSLPSLSGYAKLRFVNETLDATTYDALLDSSVIASAVTAAAAPAYVTSNSGTYTVTIRNTASGATMATQASVALGVSLVYTVHVAGTASAPVLLIVQDK